MERLFRLFVQNNLFDEESEEHILEIGDGTSPKVIEAPKQNKTLDSYPHSHGHVTFINNSRVLSLLPTNLSYSTDIVTSH
jgi:hypothetical protein